MEPQVVEPEAIAVVEHACSTSQHVFWPCDARLLDDSLSLAAVRGATHANLVAPT